MACLGLLALAGGAAAADYIPGSELEHRQSGTGQFETYHWDSNVDIFKRVGQPAGHGDAGITLALYEDDGASATTYGLYGQQPFQNLTQPTRTGTGSGATPYVLESQYYAGEYDTGGVCQGNPCIRVTELAEYTSSAPHSLFMTYRVTNDGTDPIRFRLSLAADIDTSGSSDGTAFVENGVPRAVGTVNPRYGASAAWQEVSGSPWTSYQEGLAFDVWRRIEGPVAGGAPSPGLNEGTTGGEGDKVLAVQWDDYVATGLAGGAFRNFETFLRFKAFSATTLTPPAWSMTGLNAPVTIPLDVRDQYGSPTALQATDVRYRVTYGPNAPIDQSWLTATPSGGTGEADITWNWNSTKVAADDGLQVWIDLDHDRIKDESEPDTSSYANWFDPFTLTRDYSQRLIGNPNEVTVTSYTSGHALTGRPYKWKVTGANPQTNPGDPVNGMFDCNPCASITAINLLDDNAGTDTVHVWQDLNADTDYDDFGEKRSVDVKWLSGLYLHAASGRNFQGNPNRVVEAELVDSFDDPIYGVPLYYRVSGANPQGDTCATGATAVDPTVEDPAENNACKTAPTADIDWWGGQADIQMPTTNVGEDTLTVWYELDGASGSGPTAGDKVVATGNYATVLSPDQRLTTNAGTSTVNKTVGSTYDLTTSLRLPSGAADGRPVKIRYSIYSGSVNYTGSDELEVANNGSGNATISLPGTRVGYDDIDLYADLDGDKVQDSNEPWTSVFIRWRERVTLEVWDTEEYIPSTGNVDVYLQRADGTPYSGAYRWRIDGGSYTNDTTFSGYDYLTIPSQAAGPHTIEVEFTDTDGTFSDTTTITWAPSQVLALTRAAAHASTGATGKVTATLTEGGAPDQGVLLHYEIYGANDDNGKRVVETDATGKAEITWKGVEAGTDWVDVWPDYDEDGVRDANEGALEQSISTVFHERIELTPTYASKYEGNQQTVTVKFHDDDYQPLASKPLTYEITGANPVAGAVVTTNGSGQASIVLTGNEAGEDILRVWQDSDGDGQRDADELASQPMEMDWSYRISATPSNYGSQATNTPFTITANLRTLTGANQSGATLRWEATGVSPASGSTAATNASGNATFQVNSQVGGRDDIVVWLDSNGDGDRDAGEPKDELSVTWTSQITITCTSCTNPKPQGNTQGFTAAKSGGGGNLKWRVDGANDVATTAYAGSITLTGTEHGSDRLLVWDDVNSNSQWDSGEVASSYYMTWSPRLAFSTTNGYRVAGGSVTVGVTLLSVTGTAVGAGQTVNYTVTGANPTTGSATTNSLGKVSVTWSGENTGTDTLTVTSGSFTNSTSVYWAPPPVSLSLSHNTAAEAYQTNTHTVTATVNNATIPPAGVPIHFSVSGANTASQTVQSNAAGVSQFTWTGTNDGTDTVVAYADLSGTTGNDGYDPASSTTMKWLPLVRLSSTTSDQAIGEPHTETVTFLTNTGAPLANARVIYQISGANPTGGLLEARPIGSASGTRVNARTDSNGNAAITWTGTNAGTDTLDAWGDANDNGIVDGAEPRATKTITWRTATASGGGSTPGTGSTPVATPSQVPPANDFDGLPTPPPPVVAKKVNVAPVSGKVLVKLPGSTRFLELLDAEQIPVGSIVDVKRGRVALTASQNLKDSAVATAEFYSGVFKIAQKRAAKPVTDLVLFGGSFRPCGKLARKSSDALAQASKAKPKKRIRQLWGNGKGLFRTKGKYAAAAIRGTIWNVTDYCNGTLVKVTQGSVTVTDIVKKRNVVVKAKKSYFAEAKPARAGRRRG